MKNLCYKGAPLGIMNIYAIFSENKNISLWGRQGNLISIFFSFFFYKKLNQLSTIIKKIKVKRLHFYTKNILKWMVWQENLTQLWNVRRHFLFHWQISVKLQDWHNIPLKMIPFHNKLHSWKLSDSKQYTWTRIKITQNKCMHGCLFVCSFQ